MKKAVTYVVSVILSVFLVFSLFLSSAMLIANIQINGSMCIELAEKKEIPQKIRTELEKNYRSKYNSSGIPADVYMDALDEAYLSTVVNAYITSGFEALDSGETFVCALPKNEQLEKSISDFFNSYADSIGYEKNETFEKKLSETVTNAYATVGSYSDIYKFSTMSNHGILSKLSKLYRHRELLTVDALGITAILLLLLMLVNFKERLTVLYWSGISSIISGILGIVPCLYLLVSRYFDSFTIKQPQVFSAFTGMMYRLTSAFIAAQIAVTIIGIALVVAYAIAGSKVDVAPTDVSHG